jgi:3-hydroxybutyryl-CoA dehydrogenase
VPGQLGNRLLHAIFREAFFIVQEGIATAEDVDTTMKYGPGLRFPAYGPLEHADVVGLDLVSAIDAYLFAELCNATEPLPLVRGLMEQGHLGVKTGRGLYDWSVRDPAAVKSARDRWLVQQMKQRIKASNKSPQMEGAAV